MRTIVNIRFGSHLYGTATPQSDLDFKAVHVPAAADILLQRVRASVSEKRAKAEREKNLPGEVDRESYSLQKYLGLISEGQTVALDVLFAPEWAMTDPPADEWREIVANRHRLLTKRAAAFVGYCRQQANKYGIKGSRVAAARSALGLLDELIEKHGTTPKLREFAAEVEACAGAHEHSDLLDIDTVSGGTIRHWEVCGRKMPYTSSIKNARDVMVRLVEEYGQRALAAERHEGVDWKALSHAVRVGREAIELLGTGSITFPLLDAAHILDIKLAKLPYRDVAAEIEDLLVDVEAASQASALPEAPDTTWIDGFVSRVYREEICRTS
jgi:hypothetical protein